MPFVPAILRFFAGVKAKYAEALGFAGMAILAFMVAYFWGRTDCGNRHQRKAAQEAAAWAEKIRQAEAASYAKGLQAAESKAQRSKTAEEITRDAGMEASSDDLCLSGDILDKIRAMQ